MIARGKLAAADIANASLAGGVAIGATCDKVSLPIAFVIGLLAGTLSTLGFAVVQGRLQAAIRKVDTCGVLYLHGLPGLLGGFAAMVDDRWPRQGRELKGIAITVVLALVLGLIVGRIRIFSGTRKVPYVDSEEFEVEPEGAVAAEPAVLIASPAVAGSSTNEPGIVRPAAPADGWDFTR